MPSSILHVPTRSQHNAKAKHILIFFVTGNPGLISYYKAFLSAIHSLLESHQNENVVYTIYGQSLAGFEDLESEHHDEPYGLLEEIDLVYDALLAQEASSKLRGEGSYDGVILIGHSVGTYIILEMLRKLRQAKDESLTTTGSSGPSKRLPRIISAILLFPTVVELAHSPSGVKAIPLFRISDFPRRFSTIAGFFLRLLPLGLLNFMVSSFTGFSGEARDVTVGFLRSKKGIRQALHMARDELALMTEDKWDDDIWGVENPKDDKEEVPKLIFYFGEDDHWVANHVRDALIASRQHSGPSSPKMMIDEGGIPHSFCIHDSETVAEKVKVWVDEVVAGYRL